MVSTDILIIPDDAKGVIAPAELELDDLLPTAIAQMPVFIRGRVRLSLEDQLYLKMAQKFRIIFNSTQMMYGAMIDLDTGEFRAVDTRERGI